MRLLPPDAPRPAGRLALQVALAVAAVVVVAFAFPAASFAAAPGALPAAVWADPDTGYWIELIVVAIITAVAGIVFNVRRKPDP